MIHDLEYSGRKHYGISSGRYISGARIIIGEGNGNGAGHGSPRSYRQMCRFVGNDWTSDDDGTGSGCGRLTGAANSGGYICGLKVAIMPIEVEIELFHV